ncbi:MAG: putative Ig domain-containing protein [Planctomycetota bacterium]|nr:putative Ig domain-containing protein [Planctomycetota bacterium]
MNGDWKLYVADDTGGDQGGISGGWSITFDIPGDPEINVQGPNTANIASGATANIGAAQTGVANAYTFTVENVGITNPLNVTALTAAASGVGNVTVTANPTLVPASPVPANSSATFNVDVTPTANGPFEFTITITNNDANEGTYTVIVQGDGAPQVTGAYAEDFESGGANWLTGGASASIWELGTPSVVGPTAAHSGSSCWGTVIAGNYGANNLQAYLFSPLLELTGTTQPTVSFFHYMNAEDTWDGGALQISVNGGAYVTLAQGDPGFLLNGPNDTDVDGCADEVDGWSGNPTGSGWAQVVIDLLTLTSATVTNTDTIRFRFWFGSDGFSNAFPGWYIDDFAVGEPAEIDVQRPAGTSLGSGTGPATDALNSVSTTGQNFTYTIANPGGVPLALTGSPLVDAPAGSQNNCTVSVTTQPADTSIAVGGTTTFVISVTPSSAAAFDFVLTIDSIDSDEPTYTINVSGTGVVNAPPVVTVGTGNWVDAGGGLFTLTLNPGATINDTLNVDDPTPNDMTVDVITAAALTGITGQPADITTPTAGTINLTWTGTADASNAPGNYDWTIDISDGTSTTSITARIIIVDVPPQHTILNASGGDGSAGSPYTYTFAVGNTGANSVDLATVTDANTSQTVTISGTPNQTSGPTGGTGFQFTLAANALTVAPAGALVAADVGTQVFEVVVSDGNVANDQTITVSLDVVANVPPAVSVGTSNWVDAGGGLFTLTLNPGAAINDTLVVTDATPDNMTVDVTAPGTALTGLTAEPADIAAPTAGPINLTWTGTAAASNTPGNYNWTIDINDGTSSTVITARIIVVDVAPQHTAATGISGDGSVGTPYATTFAQNDPVTLSVSLANVTDANTGQTLTLTNIAQGSGPTGGSGFTFSLAGGVLSVAPTATLVAADIGVQVFSMDVDDGPNTVTINVSITVLGNSGAITFTNTSPLAGGTVGVVYATVTLVATGGSAPYTYSLVNGTSLPAGLSLSATGDITGTPTAAGTVSFDVRAVDNASDSAVASFQITISAPSSGSGGGGGDDGGCSSGGSAPYSWMLLLGLLGLGAVAIRTRKA